MKKLFAIGDVHGKWTYLMSKIEIEEEYNNSSIFVCGDFGVGFYLHKGYNHSELSKLNNTLRKVNSKLYVVRGNHDNPEVFGDYSDKRKVFKPKYSNIIFVKDYTVVDVGGIGVLCVGGATSIDKDFRIENVTWWKDENVKKNVDINYTGINVVISHEAPISAYPVMTMLKDERLSKSIYGDRRELQNVYNNIVSNTFDDIQWYYGHYHESKIEFIHGNRFRLLDELEIEEIKINKNNMEENEIIIDSEIYEANEQEQIESAINAGSVSKPKRPVYEYNDTNGPTGLIGPAGDPEGIEEESDQKPKNGPRRVYEWNGDISETNTLDADESQITNEVDFDYRPTEEERVNDGLFKASEATDMGGEDMTNENTNIVDISKGKSAIDIVKEGILYELVADLLVKPLEPVKIKKTVTNMVPNGKKTKDGHKKYDTKTEDVEVESEFRRGVLLKANKTAESFPYEVGDIVIYHVTSAKEFDLFKDSVLVKPYSVIAYEKA